MALHGQSLEILEIGEEDAGEFICEVETFGPPLDQVHTLEVLGKNYTMEVLGKNYTMEVLLEIYTLEVLGEDYTLEV
jgi:hypothetical protein